MLLIVRMDQGCLMDVDDGGNTLQGGWRYGV